MEELKSLIHDLIELAVAALLFVIYHITLNNIIGIITLAVVLLKLCNEWLMNRKLRNEGKDKRDEYRERRRLIDLLKKKDK
jgi:hypothetical protein